jgi:hypothetical protein
MVNYLSDDLVNKEVAVAKLKFNIPIYKHIRSDVKRLNKSLRKIGIKLDYGFKTVLIQEDENKEDIAICNFCVIPIQRIRYKDGTKYGREGIRLAIITHLKKRKHKFTFLDLNDLLLAKDEWIVKYLGMDYDHDKKYYKNLKRAIKHCNRYPVIKKKLVIDLTKEKTQSDVEKSSEIFQEGSKFDLGNAAQHLLNEINQLHNQGKFYIKSEAKRGRKQKAEGTEYELGTDSVSNPHLFGWYNEKEFRVKSDWVNEFMEKHDYKRDSVLELLHNEEVIEVDTDYKGTPKERIHYFIKRTVYGIKNVQFLLVRRNKMEDFLQKPESTKEASADSGKENI